MAKTPRKIDVEIVGKVPNIGDALNRWFQQAADPIERRFGRFGEREQREFPIDVEEVRASGAGEGQFTVRGHAAVFEQWSLDLGGFREKIDPAAFDEVL